MSAKSDDLFGQSVAKYESYQQVASRIAERYSKEGFPNRPSTKVEEDVDTRDKDFRNDKPETKTFKDNLSRIAPDWDRRRKLGNVKMKTFLKIYLSKWFWIGLEWFEVEFLQILLDRVPDEKLEWIKSNKHLLVNRKGFLVFLEESLKDEKLPFHCQGLNLMEMSLLQEYIYSEKDSNAVWKLRSVQSLRDSLFIRVTGHEHEGKTGIKKARIRGYRDGKSSPRDPKLTKLAREVDRIFYEEQFQLRWQQVEEEINRLMKT